MKLHDEALLFYIFQSQHGLISSEHPWMKKPTVTAFNPNMVWFQVFVEYRAMYPQLSFNPNMVWFQVNTTCLDVSTICLSIPTWSDFKIPVTVLVQATATFQSQHGLISSIVCLSAIQEDRSFNPNMVWFQAWPSRDSKTSHLPFNPNMVWFQVFGAGIWKAVGPFFQSQHGLISSLIHFNTQFYELGFQSQHGLISSSFRITNVSLSSTFQSQHGLISSISTCHSTKSVWSFNPNMVWFQENLLPQSGATSLPFNPNMVWFQDWIGVIYPHSFSLSIPTWSDFKCLLRWRKCKTGELSIPTWSDFKFPNLRCPHLLHRFQSQHGLISSFTSLQIVSL